MKLPVQAGGLKWSNYGFTADILSITISDKDNFNGAEYGQARS